VPFPFCRPTFFFFLFSLLRRGTKTCFFFFSLPLPAPPRTFRFRSFLMRQVRIPMELPFPPPSPEPEGMPTARVVSRRPFFFFFHSFFPLPCLITRDRGSLSGTSLFFFFFFHERSKKPWAVFPVFSSFLTSFFFPGCRPRSFSLFFLARGAHR